MGTTFAGAGWLRAKIALCILPTTIISFVLVIYNVRGYSLPSFAYQLTQTHRASVQILVQVLAGILGSIQVAAVTTLVAYATRAHCRKRNVSLNNLRMWTALRYRSVDFSLPGSSIAGLLAFILAAYVPAALWAGALTPVSSAKMVLASLEIPDYTFGMQYIREYPLEIGAAVPRVNTATGYFSYSVGVSFLGSLLSSAATATTLDSSPRRHAKFDTTGYNFVGRSYGVGASPGLADKAVTDDQLALAYSYLEPGYNSTIQCIYNVSSGFLLSTYAPPQYIASGPLPDSGGREEYSVFFGHNISTVVAIGVTYWDETRRYVAFAAGSDYANLNKVQCTVDFSPVLFNVTVNLQNRTIAVGQHPIQASDIEPSRNLTKTAMRQFELISNVQTNLYISFVGESFNASIATLQLAAVQQGRLNASLDEFALEGVVSSLTSMMDDMLVGYGSAQLMVARDRQTRQAVVITRALHVGQKVYIYAAFAINGLILLACVIEALRTRVWSTKTTFDYTDVAGLIVGASKGGRELGETVIEGQEFGDLPVNLQMNHGLPYISLETEAQPLTIIGGDGEEYRGLVRSV